MSELTGVPAVDVTRGERVESIHAVAVCACDDTGAVIFERGAVDVPVFLRSTATPFIAAAVVRSGADARFGFEPHEIAMMAASHAGEPLHVATVTAILAKIGASASDLVVPLDHNCSGKHAGLLALARLLDAPAAGYVELAHPAERAMIDFCELVFADRFTPDRLGVDGCGIPNFATTLRVAATAFARLATLSGTDAADRAALATVRAAMIDHPWYVGGTGRFDTDAMRAAGGSLVAKGGAEGVQGIALVARGEGLALKVIDGARRAVAPATLAALRAFAALPPALDAALGAYGAPAVTNAAGAVVGRIAARAL